MSANARMRPLQAKMRAMRKEFKKQVVDKIDQIENITKAATG